MITFDEIKEFLNKDKRFSYEIPTRDEIAVSIRNSENKFLIKRENMIGIRIISGIGSMTGIFKISFNIYDMVSFKRAIETIYKSAIVANEKQSEKTKISKEAIEYPRGGNTMCKQTVNKSFDFLNDYKVVKLAEKAINDNFAELAELFFNYSNSEEELETILLCGNSKVLFFAHGSNRKITIEFGQDGEEPFRYVHTNNGINLLNDYDPKALNTIGNLIESAVDAWLEDDENRMNSIGLNDHMLSLVDNIKTMINLINTTIRKYNA